MLTLRVVPDKSISHRALYYALLARGTSRIRELSPALDVQRTLRVIRALGACLRWKGETLHVEGTGGRLREPGRPLYAGNSGTTVRIGLGVATLLPGTTVWYGDTSLHRRPMDRVIRPLVERGAVVLAREDRFLPLALRGGRPAPFAGRLPVASAQVKSALLFSGLFAEGPTRVEEPAPSRDHTERLFQHAGLPITIKNETTVELDPVGELPPLDLTVPGDPSSAAVFAALAILAGVPIRFEHLLLNPRRTRFFEFLARMGHDVRREQELQAPEPVGQLELVPGARLRPVEVLPEDVPRVVDEVFFLTLLASQAEGTSRFTGLSELRVKESDRFRTTLRILRAAGLEVRELPDGWEVPGPQKIRRPSRWIPTRDHRMVMLQAVILAVSGGSVDPRLLSPAGISDPWFVRNLETCVRALASSDIR